MQNVPSQESENNIKFSFEHWSKKTKILNFDVICKQIEN